MADLRLGAIDRVRLSTGSIGQEGRDRGAGHQRPRRERSARERLVAALAPGRQPEACEVDYVVNASGMVVAVLLRDVPTGEVIARINAEDLWKLGAHEAAGGLLLERKG